LFISHSVTNNAAAMALRNWLAEQGFDDVFLDIDPNRGLAAGERWQEELKGAADRCEAVLFLVSPAWLSSKWCLAEFLLAKSLDKRIFGLIVELVPFDQLPVEMTAEWQLCRLVGDGGVRSFKVEVRGTSAQVTFREAGLHLLRRGLERAGLDPRSFAWPPPDDPHRAPYRGLKALEPQDAAIFFGRDAAIVRGLDRIRGLAERGVGKLLVILGASGSGKSSFLRAGLWPRLARDDTNFLPLPVIRPQTAVINGSTGLAAALASAFDRLGAAHPPGHIKEALAGGAQVFGRLLDELSALAKRRLVAVGELRSDPAIILPLDQAEELFNQEGATEAEAFLNLLSAVLTPGAERLARRLLVVVTIRSDRYELLQNEPRLAPIKRDLFDLPPIPQAEFKSVIEGPARRVVEAGGRLAIDPALTEKLIADAQGADALPLLSFILERLYVDYAGGGRLTVAEYERLGGMQGSIEAAVANALAEPGRMPAIPPEKEAQLAALRAAFIPSLARINPETGVPMRRVARRDEIPEGSPAIVERLVEARLLVADQRAGFHVIEAAHESLLRQWPALTVWLDADAADLKLAEEVERAAGEWARNGRLDPWLDHRGDRLRAAEFLIARDDFRRRLGGDGAAYLAVCQARDEMEQKDKDSALVREQARLSEVAAAQARTARVQRGRTWALSIAGIVLAAGVGAVFWQQARVAAGRQAVNEARLSLVAEVVAAERMRGNADSALRLALYGLGLRRKLHPSANSASPLDAELAAAVSQSGWRLVLGGHEQAVLSAAFSPDGSRILTASYDNTARIWDAVTGSEIAVLQGEKSRRDAWVWAISRDGKHMLSGWYSPVSILEATTGRVVAELRGHEGDIEGEHYTDIGELEYAAFSADGSRIVTASRDETVRIWNAATGDEIGVWRGPKATVVGAAFNADASRIVTALTDKTARIWDAATGKEIAVLSGHESGVISAAFSLDGARVVTASGDKTARVWDAVTAKEITALHGHEELINDAAFSPDGSRIVTASEDKTARIWDAATGKEIAVLRGHENGVLSAAFSPDGLYIVTASRDKTARVWDYAEHVLILGGHRDAVSTAEFSPDGQRVASASGDKTARVWDAMTGHEIATLSGHEGSVTSASFNADGSQILTTAVDETARVWDARTGRNLAVVQLHENALGATPATRDGLRIATASNNQPVRVRDAATGEEVAKLGAGSINATCAAFSPDGRAIVAPGWGQRSIWDVATGLEIVDLQDDVRGEFNAATFSPDGFRIATAASDATARIWDASTGRQISVLRGHDATVTFAAFSPNASRVVTASMDKTARVWDAATGKEIAVLRGHDDEVSSAHFSPDGSHVVTASRDKTVRIWNVSLQVMSTDDLVAEVCRRRLRGLSRTTNDEMRLLGFPSGTVDIDVCVALE
jgi:WD40 repeat protein